MLWAAALKTGEFVQWLEDACKDHVRVSGGIIRSQYITVK